MDNQAEVVFLIPPTAEVELVSMLQDPGRTISILTRGYLQQYSTEISEDEIANMLQQAERTKLQTPLEAVLLVYLLKRVTRAFTHQLVRTRIGASYVQESLRFSDKRKAEVLLPASICRNSIAREQYAGAIQQAFTKYSQLLDENIPIEDARGILPHNVLTSVFVVYNLSTLIKVYEQRTCCQAQHGEWGVVINKMKKLLPEELQAFLKKPWETDAPTCGFGASFDRPCQHQEMFNRNIAAWAEKLK